MVSVRFQGKPFNTTIIQVYSLTSKCCRSWNWRVLWRATRPSRTNTPKRYMFHYRDLKCKSRKSRDTWNNKWIWLWSTEWSSKTANRVLPREYTAYNKHRVSATQEKTLHRDVTRCSKPKSDWFYFLHLKIEKPYTVSKRKTEGWLWLRSSWTPYCQIQT